MNHEDEIRLIAYRIWEDEGCPDGLHQEHWGRAETIWREQHSPATTSTSSSPKASSKKKRAQARSRHSKR